MDEIEANHLCCKVLILKTHIKSKLLCFSIYENDQEK